MNADLMIQGKRLLIWTEVEKARNRGIDIDDLESDLDFAVICFEQASQEFPSKKVAFNRNLMECLDKLHRKILARLGELPKPVNHQGELALFQ